MTPTEAPYLRHVEAWDVYGKKPDPAKWRYQVDEPTPDGGTTARKVTAEDVLHLRLTPDPGTPWLGVSVFDGLGLAPLIERNLVGFARMKALRIIPGDTSLTDMGTPQSHYMDPAVPDGRTNALKGLQEEDYAPGRPVCGAAVVETRHPAGEPHGR